MSLLAYILVLIFLLIVTPLASLLTVKTWQDSTSSDWECVLSGFFTVFLVVACIIWIVNGEKLTEKPEYRYIIKTDAPAVIDTTFTKSADGNCDTTYTYKIK